MLLKDFDFDLPKSSIALRPVSPRNSARLLVLIPLHILPFQKRGCGIYPLFAGRRCGGIQRHQGSCRRASRVSSVPRPNSPVVEISLTLIERLPDGSWKASRVPPGVFARGTRSFLSAMGNVHALRSPKDEQGVIVVTACCGDSVKAIMASQGAMPIPPYIANTRARRRSRSHDYQTVYAKREGAVLRRLPAFISHPSFSKRWRPKAFAALS